MTKHARVDRIREIRELSHTRFGLFYEPATLFLVVGLYMSFLGLTHCILFYSLWLLLSLTATAEVLVARAKEYRLRSGLPESPTRFLCVAMLVTCVDNLAETIKGAFYRLYRRLR